ncbi:MAG: polysaccharide biosynthesis tyrosine autokinase [Mucilaginibacter sp.]
MSTEINRGPQPRKVSKKDEVINIRAIIIKYLSYWPYTIVSVLLCFVIAFVFLKRVKTSYQVKATVVLEGNEDNKSNDTKNQDINITTIIPVNVEDELELLVSRNLTRKAIDSLGLNAAYRIKSTQVTDELYDQSPIKFESLHLVNDIEPQRFEVTIKDNLHYNIKFKDKQQDFLFTDSIGSDIGQFKITPTINLPKFIGATITVDVMDPNTATNNLLGVLEATQKYKQASTVELTISDNLYKRGQDYLNTLIHFYNIAKNEQKNSNTKKSLVFINKRLDSLGNELNDAENGFEDFRSKRKITDISAQAQQYRQDQQTNNAKLNDVNVQLNVINELENYVNSSNQLYRNPSTFNIQDPGLVSLVQKYADLLQERAALLATTPEKNPIFEPLNRKIESAKASIKENIKNIKSTISATRKSLQEFGQRYTAQIQQLPGEERQLNDLKRQQTAKEVLYNYLLQKKEELSLRYASTLSSATIIDTAYSTPLKGVSRMIAYGLALVMGLMLPGIFAIIIFVIRNRITSTIDIEQIGIPIIAEISRVKTKIPLVFLVPKNKRIITIIEQFRSLRNELYHLHAEKAKGHVTLITSTIAAEGKSFITTNLALALASAEKKTIIVEMDLYNPVSPQILDVFTNNPGITGYLRHQAQIQDIIIPTTISPDLDIIESGAFVDNYPELLEQLRMEQLIAWLKLRYDHILIKASPMEVVNDANVLSSLCDVTLYVICYDFTSKSHLPFIKKVFTEKHMPKMAVIFNKVQKK